MKIKIILILAMACLIAGCNQIDSFQPVDEGDCLVSFNLIGEINTSETPITKASSEDIYLIQVYEGPNNFAFGIFDNTDFRLFLKKDTNYQIIISVLKGGKTKIGDNYSYLNNSININDGGNNNWSYDHGSKKNSFFVYKSYVKGNTSMTNVGFWCSLNNMCYNATSSYCWYNNKNENTPHWDQRDQAYLKDIMIASIFGDKYPQCDDWFYGEINDYSPTGEYETLNFDLKRVGFKLKYELSGVTDGEVTVKVYNSTKTFIDNTTSTATYSSEPVFYAFYEARNAWLYADDYMENMTLAVSWKRGIGVTEDYGTKTIQIKRNCLNNIKIQMTSADQNAGMHLTVEAESTIGAEAVTIPVQ